MKSLLMIALLMPMMSLATVNPTPTPEPTARAESDATSQSYSTASTNSNANSNSSGIGQSNLNQTIKSEKTAPAVFTTGTNNNLPCHGEWHAGGSVLGGGVSFGKDRKDKDCLLKTAADELYDRGNYTAAARLYCKIPYYVDALGKECFDLLSLAPADLTVTEVTGALDDMRAVYATKEEVQAAVDKAFKSSTSK